MAYSKYIMPTPTTPETEGWLKFIENILPQATIFGLVWKAIDKVFEYFGRKSKAQTKEIVDELVSPQIDRLEKMIRENQEEVKEQIKGLKSNHR